MRETTNPNENENGNDEQIPAKEVEVEEGDRVTIAYDSPQSETPVEKTGEVVKTWNTGYELVADADDEDRRIKVVTRGRQTDHKNRARVTSKLRKEEADQFGEWRHGSELGYLERAAVEGDEEDDADPFHPDDLDAKHVQPYGVRVTTPDGEEFEFEVPETFRGMNLNDLLELYRERVAMDGVDDLEPGRWYAEQVEEDHGVNPDDEDGPVVLPDGGQVQPADDDEGYPADASADATEVHGVQENTSGISGLCVLYSVHGLHYRVRLRPVNPLDCETFDRGDAWTVYEWAEVETPEEDAPSVSFEEIHYVPAVVREQIHGPVQVPDRPGHVE